MFTNTISQTITAAQKTAYQNAINDMKLLFAWFLNLTPEDRKKILKMGDKSVAFVRGVLTALQANPSVVGSSFDVAEFEKDVVLWDDLQQFLMLLRPLSEGLEDTLILLGNELMRQAIAGYHLLQENAKTNSNLTQTVKDLGERFKKAEAIEPTVFTLPPQGKMTLNGIVPDRQFKILSGSSVTIFKGPDAVGKSKVVGLGTPIQVPFGWTTLTAVSNDAQNPTIFSIIQK